MQNDTQDLKALADRVGADATISEFLSGVVGLVEAERFEQHSLWLTNSEEGAAFGGVDEGRKKWIENNAGYGVTVGKCAKMPVVISLMTAVVDGRKLLFFHPTSQVVDHRLIDAWLDANMPDTARRADGYLNRVDAMNFCNVFGARHPPMPDHGDHYDTAAQDEFAAWQDRRERRWNIGMALGIAACLIAIGVMIYV